MTRESHNQVKSGATSVTIRRASTEDEQALRRLAHLDSTKVPDGPLLVAEIEGELVAGVSLVTRESFADPFTRTLEIRGLLELRASQLAASVEERDTGTRRRAPYSASRTTGRRLALASSSRRTGVV
jgi:hypothetical protein